NENNEIAKMAKMLVTLIFIGINCLNIKSRRRLDNHNL
ncbi:MAG: hypothetical protein RI995_1928, partial [Bacteroidota bacterium]